MRLMRLLAALALSAACCTAQFAPLPEAESAEEFDAYLAVLDAASPSATIAGGDAFAKSYPQSTLRGHVLERQFDAYRRLGQEPKAIEAGEQALAASPDNIVLLADLAGVLANGATTVERLAKAERYARRAMEVAQSLKLPKFLPLTEWTRIEARVNSQAHAALGLVANQRGDAAAAIREFEAAVKLAPEPDAAQHYRLGLLYRDAGNGPRAREEFRRAAESGVPAIRDLAKQQLERP